MVNFQILNERRNRVLASKTVDLSHVDRVNRVSTSDILDFQLEIAAMKFREVSEETAANLLKHY